MRFLLLVLILIQNSWGTEEVVELLGRRFRVKTEHKVKADLENSKMKRLCKENRRKIKEFKQIMNYCQNTNSQDLCQTTLRDIENYNEESDSVMVKWHTDIRISDLDFNVVDNSLQTLGVDLPINEIVFSKGIGRLMMDEFDEYEDLELPEQHYALSNGVTIVNKFMMCDIYEGRLSLSIRSNVKLQHSRSVPKRYVDMAWQTHQNLKVKLIGIREVRPVDLKFALIGFEMAKTLQEEGGPYLNFRKVFSQSLVLEGAQVSIKPYGGREEFSIMNYPDERATREVPVSIEVTL